MSKVGDLIEGIDMDKINVTINIASGLIAAGNEILDILKEKRNISDIELLELIEKHNTAKEAARNLLIESIKNRQD